MGKCLAALLIITTGLFLPHSAVAHEQTRRVQEQLRYRHLYYGNPNGEYTPELRAALKRYQARKGLEATGLIDSDTLASLGIAGTPPPAEGPAPVATETPGRGPDAAPLDVRFFEQEQIKISLPPFEADQLRLGYDPAEILALRQCRHDGIPPFQTGFNLVDEPTCCAALGCGGVSVALQSPDAAAWQFAANPDGQLGPAGSKANRSHRRGRHLLARKETNPIILAYNSVNRAMHNFFGDSSRKKKRVASRR
jgi:peptidoglycan hydrolase-like protein with peptidoglycan-binding domain